MRCATLSSIPGCETIDLVFGFRTGYRLRASLRDCLHRRMVGCMIADLTLRGIRSHENVVAARVLPEPVGASDVRKCM